MESILSELSTSRIDTRLALTNKRREICVKQKDK